MIMLGRGKQKRPAYVVLTTAEEAAEIVRSMGRNAIAIPITVPEKPDEGDHD